MLNRLTKEAIVPVRFTDMDVPGVREVDDKLDPAELAAYTAVASIILNLDETITKG